MDYSIPFFPAPPLGSEELSSLIQRVEQLAVLHHRFRDALDLANRIRTARWQQTTPLEIRHRLLTLTSELYRHVGSSSQAEVTAKELFDSLNEAGGGCSYDEIACSQIQFAAALFDLNLAPQMLGLLAPWNERCDRDPRLFRPLTRIMLWNTTARALMAISAPVNQWRPLFCRSIELQKIFYPADIARTENYLIHALLRSESLSDASSLIGNEIQWQNFSEMSRWMRIVHRAELARRLGEVWESPMMEQFTNIPTGCEHPFALYFLATGRQMSRPVDDRERRLISAAELIHVDHSSVALSEVTAVLSQWFRVAAVALKEDPQAIKDSLRQLTSVLETCKHAKFAQFHQQLCLQTGLDPSARQVDRALQQIPII